MTTSTWRGIADRQAELERLANFDRLSRSQDQTWQELNYEWDQLDEQRRALERTADRQKVQRGRILDAVRGGSHVIGGSDDGDPLGRNGGRGGSDRPTGTDRRSYGGDPWEHRTGALALSPADLRGRAISAIERIGDDAPGAQMLAEMVERHPAEHDESTLAARWAIAVSDPEYVAAFRALLRDPATGNRMWTGRQLAAMQRATDVTRALQVGDGTAGAGPLAPFTLDASWQLTSAGEIDPVRQLATVRTIAGYEYRAVTTAGVTAHRRAESGETDDDTPTFAQPVVHPERWDVFVPFSFEAQEDATALEEQLRMAMADARAQLEAAGWISGAGHAASPPQPQGMATAINDSASEVTPGTAETFAAADLPKLMKAVPPRFRANMSVLMDYATYLTARNFTPPGSTTAAPLFNDDETRVLGKRWYEAIAMRSTDDINPAVTADNVIAIADNVIAIAGDFKRGYTIVDRIGQRIELVPHLFGPNRRPTGERGLFCYGRTSGGVTNLNALRGLNIETAA